MKKFSAGTAIWLSFAVLVLANAVSIRAQAPLMQEIRVYNSKATPSPTPLVKNTGGSSPSTTTAPVLRTMRTSFPALAEVQIPGNSGLLIESLDGKLVAESHSTDTFNPASNVKVATAYAVIKTFGPEFRFMTNIYTDGTVDRTTGVLTGNVYVSGRDPMFGYEHAVDIANELNRQGIRSVTGDLVVTDNFAMNFSGSAARSSETLISTIDASKRSAAATRVWQTYLNNSGRYNQISGIPSVTFTGKPLVMGIPSSLHLLFSHESAPIREIIKATLCYSNNFLAERLGDMLGGAFAVTRVVQQNTGLQQSEFSLATSSGLGINRVSPSAMMRLLRALRTDLARYKMTFADIMPVAGVDKGTLENRFADFAMGSVVGKTGTLGVTDAGVSALSGEINTKGGRYLFVIFNQHGGVQRFRAFQNSFVSLVQNQFGGPVPLAYNPVSLDVRLARTRISYPAGRDPGKSQYLGN